MGKEDVTEVLQWMDLAMGTNANSIFSDEAPVTLKSVLARLQHIKAESDLNKNEVDRYKRELEVATASAKIKAESDKNEIDRYKRELEAVNAKYNATRVELDGFKSEKDKTIAVFKDVFALKNGKIRELEVELGKVRVESTIYQNELSSKIAAELNSVVTVQEKIGEIIEILANNEEMNSDLRKSLHASITSNTIRARFTEISSLNGSSVYSQTVEYDDNEGFEWSISVHRKKGGYLAFYLHADNLDEECSHWSCSVFADFQIISHDSEQVLHSQKLASVFDENGGGGFDKFISFKNLLNPDKGYVKDDSIIVAVVFRAYPSD